MIVSRRGPQAAAASVKVAQWDRAGEIGEERLQGFVKAIDGLNTWIGKTFSWLIVGLTLAICYEVVARYAFKAPTAWAYDVSLMFYGTLFMMAGAYTLAAFSGAADVDAISLTMGRLAGGSIDSATAGNAILIAVAVNTGAKVALAWVTGGARCGWQLALPSLAAVGIGFVVFVIGLA